jgi:hypothetical protein
MFFFEGWGVGKKSEGWWFGNVAFDIGFGNSLSKKDCGGSNSLPRQSRSQLVLLCFISAALPRKDVAFDCGYRFGFVAFEGSSRFGLLPSKRLACISMTGSKALQGNSDNYLFSAYICFPRHQCSIFHQRSITIKDVPAFAVNRGK